MSSSSLLMRWLRRLYPQFTSGRSSQEKRQPWRRRGAILQLEALEDRLAPAASQPLQPLVGPVPSQSPTPPFGAYTPVQIRTAYGINSINLGGVPADGTGQTVAIVDAYNDPDILNDLDGFDKQFTLSASPQTIYQQYGAAASFLTVYNQNGTSITANIATSGSNGVPTVDPAGPPDDWEGEESLDVEWVHAIAPGAKIDFIECNDANSLFVGAATAATLPGVSVVSMSWGSPELFTVNEQADDSTFTTPNGHQGVVFAASSGDSGSPGGFPAYSPNVVAVGGTHLNLNGDNTYQSESAWGDGLGSSSSGSGSGGGFSLIEAAPAYQTDAYIADPTYDAMLSPAATDGFRAVPDVSFDADPDTGVAVYDSYDDGASTPWEQIGGTSLAAPCWAGLIAIADAAHESMTGTTFNSTTNPQQVQTALYSLPTSDYHDITSGSNGEFTAGPGYDEVTGLGSPVANQLVPDLAAFDAGSQWQVVTQPTNVNAGSTFSLTVDAVDAAGNLDTSVHGSVTVSLSSNPGGSTLGGTLTETAVDGVATFPNLSLNNSGAGYVLKFAGAVPLDASASVLTSSFDVAGPPAKVSFTTEPPSNITMSSPFSPVVLVTDASGTPVAGVTVTMSISSGVLSGTLTATTDSSGEATFSNLSESTTGTYTLTAAVALGPSDASTSFTVTDPPAALVYVASPSNTSVGAEMSPVTVQANDAAGDPVGGVVVTLTISAGTLFGALTATTDAAGQAVFSNLVDDQPGTYTLSAAASGVPTISSGQFQITGSANGAVAALSFTSVPATATAGVSFGPVTVTATDPFSNPVAGATISLGISVGTLVGTVTAVTNAAGVATFNGLTDTTSGHGVLTASVDAVSATHLLTISPGPAVGLAFVTQPPSTSANTSTFTVSAEAVDQFGNLVPNVVISLSISSGSLSGTTSVTTDSNGLATFSGLSVSTVGTYTLKASATGLASVNSDSFTITLPSVTQLTFVTEPNSTSAGSILNSVTVLAEGPGGPASGVTVSISISAGTLGGTLTATTNAAGDAVFSNLSVDKAGIYALTAVVQGQATVTSSSFTITAGQAATLSFVTEPANTGAGITFSPVDVQAADAFGNPVTGLSVTVVNTVPGTLLGTTTVATNSAGQAIFSTLIVDVLGTYTMTASAQQVPAPPQAVSTSYTIAAGAPARITFTSEPNSTSAGTDLNAVTVQVADEFGNLVPAAPVSISISPGALSTGTTPLTTNAAGQVVFGNLSEDLVGNYTLTASSATAGASSSTFTITAATPAQVSFTSQPTSTAAGSTLNPITVQIVDQYGNAVTGGAVSLSLSPGILTTGTTSLMTNGSGQAVFSNLSETTAGTYSLIAASAGLASAVSDSFAITGATAFKLSFVNQPAGTTAGGTLAPVTVQVTDKYGNTVAHSAVSIGISSGTLASGATPQTTDSVGQAVFSSLSETVAGTFTLTASESGLTSASSASFTITPNYSSGVLTFVGQPSSTTVGSPLYPVTVKAVDQYGNVLTGASISMGISSGTLATGAGPLTANTLGEAVFTDLTDTLAGTYTLTGSIAGGGSGSSNSFVLTPAAPSVLTFLTEPTSTTAGSQLGQITVQVTDKYGNTVTGGLVNMGISSGTLGSGTLSAFTNAAGQATFSNLTENIAGTYMLLASASGTVSFSSSAFVISSATATATLSFLNQPSSVTAGAVFSAVTVKEVDAFGNALVGVPVNIGLVSGTLTSGTTPVTTNAQGRAIFNDLTETVAGSCTLTASAAGLASVNSSAFTVFAGLASQLSFATPPSSTTAGSSLGVVTVQVADKYSNPVAGVSINIGLSSGKLTTGATAAVSTSSGQAIFTNLTETTAGTYTLTATATGLAAASSSFVISPAAVSILTFLSQPTSTTAGTILTPITVKAADKYGNAASGAIVNIGLSSGTLTSGTTPLTAGASGQVVFNDLIETKSGTYALNASVTGLASATSSLFAISSTTASTVTFLTQPSSIVAGGNLGAITVQVADKYGNAVSGNAVTVSMPTGVLSGTPTAVTTTAGQATFTSLSTTMAGTWTLSASVTGLASASSNTFIVSPLAASKLSILSQPTATSAGTLLSAVTVRAVDSLGNGIGGVVIGIGISPGSLTSGTTPLTTNATGYAIFNDLDENAVGTYTLTATASGLASVKTNAFVVSPAAVSTLSFVSQPASAPAGTVLNSVVVKVADAFGNLESGKTVTMSVSPGSLGGTTTAVTSAQGLATFSNLTVATGGADTLTATSGSASVASNVFAVISGTNTLSFVNQPASVAAGTTLAAETVLVADASSNPLPGVAVTMSLLSGTLSGTTTATTNASGDAVFSNLSVSAAGTYSLSASSKGLTSVSSSSFIVTGATAAKLSFFTQPTTIVAGNTFNSVTVKVVDTFGNPVGGTLVSISLSAGTLSGSTTAVSSSTGLAVFSTLSTTTGGVLTLTASVAGLASVSSNSFTVTGSSSVSYSFLSQPSSTVAGSILSPVTLQVIDQFGNGVAGIPITLKTSINTVSGTTTLTTNASGLAVFSNLTIVKTGSYTLTATAGSLGQLASGTFTISPAKGFVSFVTQPLSTNTANLLGPITVAVLDQYGNAVPGTIVSIHSSANNLGGVTIGTTSATGQVTFATLTLAQAGTYSLTASASGLTTVNSSKFTITTATARLAFTTPPTTGTANAAMSPVVVQLYNASGAPLAQANVAVTVKVTVGGLTGTLTVDTNSSGQAIFSNLILGASGTYTMVASAFVSGQAVSVASGPFNVF